MATYRYSDAFWLRKTLQLLMILLLWFLLLRLVSYEPKAQETDLGSSQVSVAVVQSEAAYQTGPLLGLTPSSVAGVVSTYSVGQGEIDVHEIMDSGDTAERSVAHDVMWTYATDSGQTSLTDTPLSSCAGEAGCSPETGDVTILVDGDGSATYFVIRHTADQDTGLTDVDVATYRKAIESYNSKTQGAL